MRSPNGRRRAQSRAPARACPRPIDSRPLPCLRRPAPATLHQAARKSARAAMLRSILVEYAAEQYEYRDEDGDPENAGREATAKAEAHCATLRSAGGPSSPLPPAATGRRRAA
jgi:hypothetical protein